MQEILEDIEYLYDDAYQLRLAIMEVRDSSDPDTYEKMILRRVSRNMDKIVPLIQDVMDEIEKLK